MLRNSWTQPTPAQATSPAAELVGRPVEERLHLSVEDLVHLLEGMVVGAGEPALLVLHHEHRREGGAEVGVDHHLDRDPAVHEQGGAHARTHLQPVLRLVGGVHRLGVDVPEVAVAGVTDVDRPRRAGGERRRESGVVAEALPRQRRLHLRERHRLGGGVPERMGGSDREEPVVAGDQLDAALGRVDGERPRRHVDGLLPGVHVAVDRTAGLEAGDAEPHLHRPGGLVDDIVAAVAGAATDELGRRPVVHGGGLLHDMCCHGAPLRSTPAPRRPAAGRYAAALIILHLPRSAQRLADRRGDALDRRDRQVLQLAGRRAAAGAAW